MILIGYSGHSYVVYNILKSIAATPYAYCDSFEKKLNPFNLVYLGTEQSNYSQEALMQGIFFISIGDNIIRKKVTEKLCLKGVLPVNAIHNSSIICESAIIKNSGIMIGAGVIINPLAVINNGVICNTGCIIEHECVIEDFAHIGPGAILCGNVIVGENSFVGAGSVIKQGIKIGKNVTIGAGSVVVKNVADNATVMGCPAK